MINYFRILGVKASANEDEIKKAYKRLSNKYHPDKLLNLTEDEKEYILSMTNKQAACLNLQSKHFKKLKLEGLIDDFRHVEFKNLIGESKATIISPSFIPKSKIREEQEIIQLVSSTTRETSFIKFNFNRIGDFWSYAVKHDCTLLVTTKNYQADLAKVLFHFYKGKIWSEKLSFYLSV